MRGISMLDFMPEQKRPLRDFGVYDERIILK